MNRVRTTQLLSVLVLLAIIVFATVILQLVVNLVLIAVGIVVLASMYFLVPPFLYALNIGSRKIDNALTAANPIEALKIQLQSFDAYIANKETQVATAMGNLTRLKKMYSDNKNNFTPSKLDEWDHSISKHEMGINTAREALSNLKKERESFRVEIQGAEADMAMAALSDGIAGSIAGTDSPALSTRRTVALDSIADRVAQSQARVDLALSSIGNKALT